MSPNTVTSESSRITCSNTLEHSDATVTISTGIALSDACAKKPEGRYAWHYARLTRQPGAPTATITATSGKIMARVKCAVQGAWTGTAYIASRMLRGRKGGFTLCVNGSTCKRTAGNQLEEISSAPSDAEWPNTSDVWPAPQNLIGRRMITLNADLLQSLASAISETGVITLIIPDSDKIGSNPVVVLRTAGDRGVSEGVGLIAQVHSDAKTVDQHTADEYARLIT